MSLITFPYRQARYEYIEALKIIWTRPNNPGRFYLGSALDLHKAESAEAYFKRLLKRDDYKGTTRPINVFLTDLEKCFFPKHHDGHIKTFAYELAHKQVWPPLLNTSFLFCDESGFDSVHEHMKDLSFLKGNFREDLRQEFYFNE